MTPCISQVTTLNGPFEADLDAYSRSGWTAVELWLTKLEQHLATSTPAEVRQALADRGLVAAAAASQGGLLLTAGAERAAHWDHFRRRLALLQELGVGTLIVVPDFETSPGGADLGRAVDSLAEASEVSGRHGVRLALEFSRSARFCSSLDTALALVAQVGSPHLGVCLDLFHYYTGPSKFEDLGYLTSESLAWVQVCDLSGVPRELASDSDRIFPGDGDFQLEPILRHLAAIGYAGPVSLELMNPQLWSIPADRVAEIGFRALERCLQAVQPPAAATDPTPGL